MRSKIVNIAGIILIFLVVSLLTVLVIDRYVQTQKQRKAAAVPMVTVSERDSDVAAQKKADDAKYNLLISSYNAQQTECQKGATAYAKLTLTVQKQVAAPQCSGILTPVE